MKSIKILLVAFLIGSFSNAIAQVSVNVNFGTPPVWAPADRVETQYYYLPEVYYDVPAERFIYINNGSWVRAERLPKRYNGYNLNGGKVIYLTDYRGNSPYQFHKNHKVKYVATKYHNPNKAVYVKKKEHKGKGKGKKH
jgi:hypothetical protein